VSRLDDVRTGVEEHEATGSYTRKGVAVQSASSEKRRKSRRTVSLLRIPLSQALVPHERRLLISDQPSNRNSLQQVTLLEVPVDLRVRNDLGKGVHGHFEKVAQLFGPVLSVEVVEESAAGVGGVGNVETAVLGAGELLRKEERKESERDAEKGVSLVRGREE
jgi:hypothetical protein